MADFPFTVTALPALSPAPSEEALLEPQAAMENANTAAREPAAILLRLFIMFLFSTSSRRKSLGEPGSLRGMRAARNPKKRNYASNLSGHWRESELHSPFAIRWLNSGKLGMNC